MSQTSAPQNPTMPADCYSCAMIDEQGREIPITEAMIQQACRALEPDEDVEDGAGQD